MVFVHFAFYCVYLITLTFIFEFEFNLSPGRTLTNRILFHLCLYLYPWLSYAFHHPSFVTHAAPIPPMAIAPEYTYTSTHTPVQYTRRTDVHIISNRITPPTHVPPAYTQLWCAHNRTHLTPSLGTYQSIIHNQHHPNQLMVWHDMIVPHLPVRLLRHSIYIVGDSACAAAILD